MEIGQDGVVYEFLVQVEWEFIVKQVEYGLLAS